jgi:hypothetical protein
MLNDVLDTIRITCQAAGRDPGGVKLIAVTKGHTLEEIQTHMLDHGHTILGENRIQEALPKMDAIRNAEWHLIGHLQTNKVKFCQDFALIHSLDSERLALELARRAESWGRAPGVLLEVNVGHEPQKHGVLPENLPALLNATCATGLQVHGLMTVAPFGDLNLARRVFRELREMRDSLGLVELSMGMTDDYPVAIQEGATMIRVGRAIFTASSEAMS